MLFKPILPQSPISALPCYYQSAWENPVTVSQLVAKPQQGVFMTIQTTGWEEPLSLPIIILTTVAHPSCKAEERGPKSIPCGSRQGSGAPATAFLPAAGDKHF